MWVDLHRGILEDFAERASDPRHESWPGIVCSAHMAGIVDRGDRSAEYQARQADPVERAFRMASKRRRIRVRRAAAVAGKVCKHAPCGKPVARPVKPGPIPDYCSPACMKRAKWARWYEVHRAERLAERAEQRRAAA